LCYIAESCDHAKLRYTGYAAACNHWLATAQSTDNSKQLQIVWLDGGIFSTGVYMEARHAFNPYML
jgi:hypothetical protein